MMGEKPQPINTAGFVESIVKGVRRDELWKANTVWRVSSLVQLWKLKCRKLLYLYLTTGEEKIFDNRTLQTFVIGHKVHDLVKEYFRDSPDFEVVHEEWGIKHHSLPITGTMDMVVTWNKYPGKEFIVEIKSTATEFMNNPRYGARFKPFNANRWQAGIYSTIYSRSKGELVPPIVLYFDKDNGDMVPHLLSEEDYREDVDAIFACCPRGLGYLPGLPEDGLVQLGGVCKRVPHKDCHLAKHCDIFNK
jgi:hypothetical protein